MKEPLNNFADRIVRNGELTEFLKGLVEEKGVSPEALMQSARSAVEPTVSKRGQCSACFERGEIGGHWP